MDSTTASRQPKGISEANRARLSLLHIRLRGPFTSEQASDALGLNMRSTRQLLPYLASRGWLSRVRPGLYITVPLASAHPSEWREDPWVVAAVTFEPCYIAGWSACEHWGLTEQIFEDVVVVTGRRVRTRSQTIQGTRFLLKALRKSMLFGTQSVWRGQVRVQVSDASRTLIDILDDPSIGGGIRHIATIVEAYFRSEMREDQALLSYAEKRGNRTVYKRLGYLVEALALDLPEVVDACQSRISSGYTKLDSTIHVRGRLSKRWNLWVNVTIRPTEAS